MKTKNTIMAVISTALLLGGTFLLVKDDAQQAQKSAEIKPYALTQDVQDSLDRIADELWTISGEFIGDNTLNVYMKRLRDKIEDDPQNPCIIRTVRGLGYKAAES